MSTNDNGTNGFHRKFLSIEVIVLGYLLGGALIWLALSAMTRHEHILHSAIEETLVVAVLLTAVVAFSGFSLPTFFTSRPRLATFTLVAISGFVSLFFDSFAVILLLSTIKTAPHEGSRYSHRFSDFVMRVAAAFNALTVGGCFYLGELWGLPHYISSGQANPVAGIPLAVVLFPYCILVSLLIAWQFPVRVEPVKFDSKQVKGGLKLTAFLVLLILTQNPILTLGVLLVFSAITGRTEMLVKSTLHELSEGGMAAIGLIGIAWILQGIPGTKEVFQSFSGGGVFVFASISSPFAGAMIAPSTTLGEFYWNVSLLMLGAPLFVFSSLVAIVVFRDSIHHSDLPPALKRLGFLHKEGFLQEAVAYTLVVIPLLIGLAIPLIICNAAGLFEMMAKAIGLTM